MSQYKEIIRQAYLYFNQRNIDVLLAMMDPDVNWPNGWEGGYVKGHNAVREYWTRQWQQIDPCVKPLKIVQRNKEKMEVEVEQIVKDLQGNILFESRIIHLYTFHKGLILTMNIMHVE